VKALPRPSVGAGDGGVFERRSTPWRHHRGALVPLPTTLAWAIRVKTQAPVSGAGDGGVFVTSLLRASLWRVDGLLLRATSLSSGLVDVGAAAPNGCCTPRRRPRKAMRLRLNGVELRLAWLGWQPCAACVARLPARSACLRGGILTFRSGRRPRMLVRRPRSTSSWPCAARVAGG
jgi:hypothetical protein